VIGGESTFRYFFFIHPRDGKTKKKFDLTDNEKSGEKIIIPCSVSSLENGRRELDNNNN
jgi:hypothetical protein